MDRVLQTVEKDVVFEGSCLVARRGNFVEPMKLGEQEPYLIFQI